MLAGSPSTTSSDGRMPTRLESVWFSFRANCFRLKRWVADLGSGPKPLAQLDKREAATVAQFRAPLYQGQNPAEFALQAGKVHNLRQAIRRLDGLAVPAGQTFSFWAQVGRPSRRRGFVLGRELREGCIIPSVGGGLCQLSNALYDVAIQSGMEIVERHAHTQRVPGSAAVLGRDATVFWNYVDLRFRADFPWQLECRLTAEELIINVRAPHMPERRTMQPSRESEISETPREAAESCETCGILECFRNPAASGLIRHGVTAWLVDAWQPEFDQLLGTCHGSEDWLFVPLDSQRRKIGPYRWQSRAFKHVVEAPLFVLERSLRSRRLAAQGAARQRALLAMDEKLARIYARKLPPEATHLVISQNLLPFLWRDGVLGGRTFDVLVTRSPLTRLEAVLDEASRAHPDSPTLTDFRASEPLRAAEDEALQRANRWLTPHRQIVRMAGDRGEQLDWQLPACANARRGERVVFPASTLGRKGAYELREALRGSNLPLRLVGPIIEDPGFWDGFNVERAVGEDWLEGARCVVLPAWVEHQPRRLLRALAAGIPVIASEACGLAGMPGVTTVPTGDVHALREAILSIPLPAPVPAAAAPVELVDRCDTVGRPQ